MIASSSSDLGGLVYGVSLGNSPLNPALIERGVYIEIPEKTEGSYYWKLISGVWLNVAQSQGRHHIYIDTVDEKGNRIYDVPFMVNDSTRSYGIIADKRLSNEHSGNFPMSPSLREYSVWINDENCSDVVRGIGMGYAGNSAEHTSTVLTFARIPIKDANLPDKPVNLYKYLISGLEEFELNFEGSLTPTDIAAIDHTIWVLKNS